MDEESMDADLAALFSDVLGDWHARRSTHPVAPPLDRELWAVLSDLGLTRLTGESGSGAGWRESALLLRQAAAHAAPVPLVEHDLLAGWLRERAGLATGAGIDTVSVVESHGPDGAASGTVLWADDVDEIVVLHVADGREQVLVVPASAARPDGHDMAGRSRGVLMPSEDDLGRGVPVTSGTAAALRERGGLARAAQMAGAMDRAIEVGVRHVSERRQFGRPLARFQAVQHALADAAGEACLAGAAVDAAIGLAAAPDADASERSLAIAVARSVAGHAATVVVRHLHQVHGAIGTTIEHELQELTRPLVTWGADFGSLREADRLVARLATARSEGVWRTIVGVPR
jgi:acyl-CoA dehydrogenase